jgi:hypothetical protein
VSSQDGATPASHLAAALSAAQCDYFATDGKVRICHATGSAKNPYVVLKVSEHACIDGHTHHADDYVAVNDPTCGGKGFLPPGAPCDTTLPCSLGYTCRDALCQPTDLCLGVFCSASDPCHVAHCDPRSGLCVDEAKVDGFSCDDGNACTQSDTCQSGTCAGADPVTCKASDTCHVAGTCDPTSGLCSSPVLADGTACDDGDPLTANDTCSAGACAGVAAAACPCFDASQIEAAWAEVQAVKAFGGVTTGNEPYQWCQDKTVTYGDGAVQTHTQMQFFEFSGRTGGTCGYWDEYTLRDGNFLGLTFASGPTGTATCQAGLGGGTYSCDGGGYTAAPTNYSTYISTPNDAITPAQATACKDLIHAFAAGKGIPCVPVSAP